MDEIMSDLVAREKQPTLEELDEWLAGEYAWATSPARHAESMRVLAEECLAG